MSKGRPKHRQLPPTDARDRASGAHSPLHVVPDSCTDAAERRPPSTDDAERRSRETTATPVWTRRRVLLLNATYEPLTALTVRRAVVLLVCDKADVVHEGDDRARVRSVDLAVEVPSVIRLRTYVRVPYRARIPMTRAALMHRDGFRCAYCGARAETIDHVVPRSRGGTHSWENCVACCAPCNHRKADKLLSELGWTLRTTLVPPSGPHWRLLASTKELDPTWLQYLGEGAA